MSVYAMPYVAVGLGRRSLRGHRRPAGGAVSAEMPEATRPAAAGYQHAQAVGPAATGENPVAEAAWTPPSWEEVVQDHSGRVYRLAYRLTGNRHDAEDLTQEVFVRVFRSLSSYTPGTFEGWLHRITTNLFLDQVRRRQRIRFDALSDDADDRLPGAAEPGPRARLGAQQPRPRRAGGARRAAPGVPRRRRAVRHRGAVVRGDRRHARHQARYRPLAGSTAAGRSCANRWPTAARPRPRAAARWHWVGRRSPVTHLGERITALVDGRLSADAVERVHAHLAGCRACRDLVEAERLMKARLATLQGPEPAAELVQRLLTLGGPAGPLSPRAGHVPGTPRPATVSRPQAGVAARSWGRRPAGRPLPAGRPVTARRGPGRVPRRRTRIAVAVLGALSVVGVGISGLAVSGAGSAEPTLVPPLDTFVVDHAAATSNLPFVDIPAGWQPSASTTLSAAGGGAGK